MFSCHFMPYFFACTSDTCENISRQREFCKCSFLGQPRVNERNAIRFPLVNYIATIFSCSQSDVSKRRKICIRFHPTFHLTRSSCAATLLTASPSLKPSLGNHSWSSLVKFLSQKKRLSVGVSQPQQQIMGNKVLVHTSRNPIGWRHAALAWMMNNIPSPASKQKNDWWSMKMVFFSTINIIFSRSRCGPTAKWSVKQPYQFHFPLFQCWTKQLFSFGWSTYETKQKRLQGPMFICWISFIYDFNIKTSI